MSGPKTNCPVCRGRGWYEGPYYGDFEPKVVKLACEDCLPHSKPSKTELAVVAAIFFILTVLMLWGPQ